MEHANSDALTARTRRNTWRLALWTGTWLVTQAVAVFGPQFAWQSRSLTVLAIVVNVSAGFLMIAANKRHLDGLDELQRKIQLDAMALALGVALVAGLAYSTLDVTNVIAADAEISVLVVLTALTYLGAVLFGRRQYQ